MVTDNVLILFISHIIITYRERVGMGGGQLGYMCFDWVVNSLS